MSTFRITAICPDGHDQQFAHVAPTRKAADHFAKLLDGSGIRRHVKMGNSSSIGKCCVPECGKPFRCTIAEIKDGLPN